MKAIVFDLDDTLYDYADLNRQAIDRLCAFTCKALDVTEPDFMAAFDTARKATKLTLGEETGASHNRLLYCQKTLEALGRRPASLALEMYEAYWGYMLEHMQLRAGAAALLAECRQRGMKIGICTDLTAHIQHRKLRRLGLAEQVDVLVTSEEAGAEKPAPAIYRLLLQKLALPAAEVLFVGDSREKDVDGPRRMGMRALWFRAGADAPGEAVTDLLQVREYLDEVQ